MAAGVVKPGGEELYCPTCEQTFARGERCPTDNTRLVRIAGTRDALIGRELEGRYTIVEQLGSGGMGAVYRGTQHQLGREVAIKVVTPALVKDAIVIKRFLREAKLASRLSHPNAVSVLDFGQTDDGLFFLVMELVNGRTLEDIVLSDGPLTPARLVRVGVQICDALEGAHSLNIIHRDLKTQNIMLMSSGRDLVKVLDFGLAKSLTPEQGNTTMTNAGALLGTPAFMPPELVLGNECDARSDLYSLGCVLYVCAAARLPFPSQSVHEVIAMHATEQARRIDGLPHRLWSIIDRLLEKDPVARYQTAGEVRDALEAALAADSSPSLERPAALQSGPSTVLGWDGKSDLLAQSRRGANRIATPVGVPRVTAGANRIPTPAAGVPPITAGANRIATPPSGVPLTGPGGVIAPRPLAPDEADLIASSATLPVDSLAAAISAPQHASSPVIRPSDARVPIAPAAPTAPVAARRGFGWKSIAAVVAAGLVAAVAAFVIVDRMGSSSPEAPSSTPSPAPPTPSTASPPPTPSPPAAPSTAPPSTAPPSTTPPATTATSSPPPATTAPPPAASPPAATTAPPTPDPTSTTASTTTSRTKPTKKPAKKPATTKPAEKPKTEETAPPRRPVKVNPGVM